MLRTKDHNENLSLYIANIFVSVYVYRPIRLGIFFLQISTRLTPHHLSISPNVTSSDGLSPTILSKVVARPGLSFFMALAWSFSSISFCNYLVHLFFIHAVLSLPVGDTFQVTQRMTETTDNTKPSNLSSRNLWQWFLTQNLFIFFLCLKTNCSLAQRLMSPVISPSLHFQSQLPVLSTSSQSGLCLKWPWHLSLPSVYHLFHIWNPTHLFQAQL